MTYDTVEKIPRAHPFPIPPNTERFARGKGKWMTYLPVCLVEEGLLHKIFIWPKDKIINVKFILKYIVNQGLKAEEWERVTKTAW